jgi:hypothetical protein
MIEVRLVSNPGISGGAVLLGGTRVRVVDLVDRIRAGESIRTVAADCHLDPHELSVLSLLATELTLSKDDGVAVDTEAIAVEVEESRVRIRRADPAAYGGFVTDAACRAVGARRGLRPVDVLRAWRKHHPAPPHSGHPPIPPGACKVSEVGLTAA